MKHLKLFESFEDIDSICKKYCIENYTINSDGTVDVNGDVNLHNKGLTKLPLKFGRVTGYFYCDNNQLTTLEGSPQSVGGTFYCNDNQLTSLEGSPKAVGGEFSCDYNQLTSLEGAPQSVGGSFYCYQNKLTTLKGCTKVIGEEFNCNDNQLITLEGGPQEVGGDFYCFNNQLTSLEGGPREVEIVYCDNNPIVNIYYLFDDHQSFMDSLDYNYIRGTDIVKSRFKEALDEIGKKMPGKIKGYNYI
jgi:hypothetical protein